MEIAYNSPDSLICFGKNITLVLSLKNNTDSIVEFIHNKPFFLIHDYGDGVFIAGEENQRIHIAIEPENSNERIILNPDQIHTFLYPVTADKKFFYNGNNTVRMLLHFQEYASIKTLPVLITCMECYH
ncbi:MAG: hypothetical protein LIO93_06410 [Bacteroidales bacterium]|nr:hypothetical protein [Bacteroidales bacterium]